MLLSELEINGLRWAKGSLKEKVMEIVLSASEYIPCLRGERNTLATMIAKGAHVVVNGNTSLTGFHLDTFQTPIFERVREVRGNIELVGVRAHEVNLQNIRIRGDVSLKDSNIGKLTVGNGTVIQGNLDLSGLEVADVDAVFNLYELKVGGDLDLRQITLEHHTIISLRNLMINGDLLIDSNLGELVSRVMLQGLHVGNRIDCGDDYPLAAVFRAASPNSRISVDPGAHEHLRKLVNWVDSPTLVV